MKNTPRPAGRPRNDDAAPALLEAARKLVLEQGYDKVSIGSIASAAGVSRQTLYSRWNCKAELVLDAFFANFARREQPNELPVLRALTGFLKNLFANLEADGPVFRHLIAAAQADAAFLRLLKTRFVQPRAAVAASLLEKAVARGELPREADIATAMDALHGAFVFRLLMNDPLDAAYAKRLARLIVGACLQSSRR
jgi:AcrR family transcriptional regulator